jgi:hypothetical protein
MKTNQDILDCLLPILTEATKLNSNANTIVVNVDNCAGEKRPYIAIYLTGKRESINGSSIEEVMAQVKDYSPKSDKEAAIEKLRAEIAALETEEK